MHMGLLCNVAPYFKAAFQGNFVEATERVLELPDESVEMFKHFQFWVYSGSILEAHENTNFIAWGLLIELWVFGEARGIPDLQNAVIDALINKNYTSKQVPTSELNRLYENTSENAPIRRLFIDWVSFKATLSNASWFAEEKRDWFPKAFLFDLAVSLFEKGAGRKCRPKDFRTVRSDYYVRALDPTSDSKDSGKEEEVRLPLRVPMTAQLAFHH